MAGFKHDVFLSHATSDKPLVAELARQLARENLKPWLDTWNLIPGTAWMPEVEAALSECAACAVIIGPGGFGPWQDEEMRAAITRRVNEGRLGADGEGRPFRVMPVLLPGVERPERSKLPGFLVATTWVEFRESLDDAEAFHRLVSGIRGVEPGAGPGGAAFEGKNPYRGLELFDVEHASLFFGREALTEWLLDALKRKPSGAEDRFLAIVGASGSGKSSLARAGLMAALKVGKLASSGTWPRAICRPGAEPFFSLANALKTIAHESDKALVFDRLQGRKDGERSLHVAVRLVLGEPPRAERLVVLVDQFEEVFTLCTEEAERRDLIANLLHAATVAGGRTIVVLTMRADFYPRCAAYAALADALSDHQVLVGPMADDELRRAIDRPARLAGMEPEPGLVELLVDDVRGRPGALPLLQFALQELWRRREAHRLTIGAYRDIGQIEGALRRKADAVYAGFTPEQQELCRRIFLRLVQPGEGSEDTRRRASLREVLPEDPAQAEAVRAIIGRLTDPESRLVTTERGQPVASDSTLEVAHEALIRGWPALRKWIEADRAGLRTHRRLTDAAKEWADAAPEAKEGSLYTGARLAVATEWATAHRDELSALEAAFLSASQEYERQLRADEAEKNRRLAETERLRAEEAEAAAGRQKKLSQRLLIAAAVCLLLAVAAGLQIRRANQESERATTAAKKETEARKQAEKSATLAKAQAKIATSRQRAALSASERNKRLDLSLLLAVEALRTENTFEARESLYQALEVRSELTSFLHIEEGQATSVTFSLDGKILAAGYHGGVVLWDVASHKRLGEPLAVTEGDVTSVAFSADGKALAAGYHGGVVLWDVASYKRLGEPLAVTEGDVTSVAFSADGKALAAGYHGGVVLWDVASYKRLGEPLAVREGFVGSVAFSADGKALAAGYRGGVVLWDVASYKRLGEPLPVTEGFVGSVAFSADGKALAAGFSVVGVIGGGVVLWDVASHKRLGEPLAAGVGDVRSVAFSPDGKALAAGYHGGVVLWDVASYKRLGEPLAVTEGDVTSVAFSADGKALAAGFGDVVVIGGGVVLWDVAVRQHLTRSLAVGEGVVASVAFSPDGKALAAGYRGRVGGGVVLWDVASYKRLGEPLAVTEGDVTSVAFSADGKALAAGYHGGVVLWDVASYKRLGEPLPVREGFVGSVAFSADGKALAAGYRGRVVLVWDVAAQKRPGEPVAKGKGAILGMAFSPDGKALAAGYGAGSVGNALVFRGGVVMWDVAAHKRLGEPLLVNDGYVWSMAFSPDGKALAAGYGVGIGVFGGVEVWDVASHKRLTERLPVREGDVRSVAFSPDGKALAAGYGGVAQGGVVVWDVASHKRLTEPLAVGGVAVSSVAFSSDGKALAAGYGVHLVGGGVEGRVVVWDVTLESWQRLAGRIANRNFTWYEWRQYFPDEPYRPTFPELPIPAEATPRNVIKSR